MTKRLAEALDVVARCITVGGVDYMQTEHGFVWGPAEVVRITSDDRLGVWIAITGTRETVEVRVTKGGRIKIGKVTKA